MVLLIFIIRHDDRDEMDEMEADERGVGMIGGKWL